MMQGLKKTGLESGLRKMFEEFPKAAVVSPDVKGAKAGQPKAAEAKSPALGKGNK